MTSADIAAELRAAIPYVVRGAQYETDARISRVYYDALVSFSARSGRCWAGFGFASRWDRIAALTRAAQKLERQAMLELFYPPDGVCRCDECVELRAAQRLEAETCDT